MSREKKCNSIPLDDISRLFEYLTDSLSAIQDLFVCHPKDQSVCSAVRYNVPRSVLF